VVRTERTAVTLAPKERALLAFLLLRLNDIVAFDVVIDALWGESPPKTVAASLHNSVSRLRKLLGAGVVRTESHGYGLVVEPDELDLHRFERLVAAARGTAAPERARQLRIALALWRGEPLIDFTRERWAQAEIRRLEELRLAATEDRLEAELASRPSGPLLPELQALVVLHPFRERLRRLLMLALYRDGRQADALAEYQSARNTLRAELGLEPGVELRQLQHAILEHHLTLAPTTRTDDGAWTRPRLATG
jgi:DNA-binding SARP family transcriptional activator